MAIDSNMLKNKAAGVMSGFSTGQRTVVGLAAAFLIVGGVLFAQWASKPTMVPLFSNVSSQDASDITAKLSSSGTPYQLADGGGTIMVPKSKVYQTRIDLAGEGLPSGGSVGYKLLDNQGITTSDFLQHVDYQRALEGELTNTITAIQGVSGATVHLVIPQQDVFSNDDKKPSASVLVKLQTGKSLSTGQVQSIVNLVASSVEGLTADNVTVSDDKGRLLASPGGSVSGTGDDSSTEAQTKMENELDTKIQNLLTPVVGSGKAVVATRAELNWDKTKETSETYNPLNKTPTPSASKSTTENYVNGSPNGSTTGCLGVGQPTADVCTGSGNSSTTGTGTDGSSYTKTDASQDNLVDKVVKQTESAPGSVSRLSVAVMYDSSIPGVDQNQITALVTQAAGLQPARGDSVTVTPMPFDKSAADQAAKDLKAADSAKKTEQLMGFVKTGATVLMVLIALAVMIFLTKKKAGSYNSTTPISLGELDGLMPALAGGAQGALGAGEDDSPEGIERAKVDREITDLIEKQPDEVAGLLRSWLADRRS
jgi:flagellar M-ring protein FliF